MSPKVPILGGENDCNDLLLRFKRPPFLIISLYWYIFRFEESV